MLKPKKGFIQAQLNIDRLTPLQWDGILRAMDTYAQHYHEEQMNIIKEESDVSIMDCVKAGNTFIDWNEISPITQWEQINNMLNEIGLKVVKK